MSKLLALTVMAVFIIAALDRHDRFPLPIPPPQAGEGAVESLREFHVNGHRKVLHYRQATRYAFHTRTLSREKL